MRARRYIYIYVRIRARKLCGTRACDRNFEEVNSNAVACVFGSSRFPFLFFFEDGLEAMTGEV